MTLEAIYDSIFSLSYIFDLVLVAFQTVYEIVILTSAISNCVVGFVVIHVFNLVNVQHDAL